MEKGRSKILTGIWAVIFILLWVSFLCPSLEAAILTYYRYYIVQKGDSLWDIGKQYGVSIKDIKRKNNLRTDRIYPGQKLIVPIKVKGVYHEVKRYETLWRICKTYKVSMEEVISLNRLRDPEHIMPGQRLFIPGATKVKKVEIPEKTSIAKKESNPLPEAEKDVIKFSPSLKKTIKRKGLLIWPVKEGIQAYRKSEFGIDIIAPEGTTIIAPAKGKVYYSGLLRNYGWTIIIEHSEIGVYTCYMHNSINLVKKGDMVEKTQPIARIGNSGTTKEIMLHFEVRRAKDGKPIDPLEFLPSRSNN